MKISWTDCFTKEYHKLSKEIQKRFDEKIQLFSQNPRHPSLRVKKMSGTGQIWEASITMQYRWTFEWTKEVIKLRHIGTHDILHSA